MTAAPSLGFPPLAGIASVEDAKRLGHSVQESSRLLHRFVYLESQANRVMVAHLSATPEWEIKQALSLHQWQDAEHSLWLRDRVKSMRYPSPNLDRVPAPRLAAFADELIRGEGSLELMVGLYRVLKPALVAAYRRYIAEANPVADYPTLRLLRFAIQEEDEQIAWGEAAIGVLATTPADQERATTWAEHLSAYLGAAGGAFGDPVETAPTLPPSRATAPFEMNRQPARDERFPLVMHFRGYQPPAEADAHEMNAWTIYKLLTEMHAPEMLATYSFDEKGRPWEFYRDVGRHLWDECRHSMLGQIAFERWGLDWTKVAHDIGFALFPSSQLGPTERYALLVSIEQRLMKPTGKSTQYGYAVAGGDEFSRLANDYDWADEVLHVQIGRKWLHANFPDINDLMAAGADSRDKLVRFVEENMHLAARPDWWRSWYADLRARHGLPPKATGEAGPPRLFPNMERPAGAVKISESNLGG